MNYKTFATVKTVSNFSENSYFFLCFENGAKYRFTNLPKLFEYCEINEIRINNWIK